MQLNPDILLSLSGLMVSQPLSQSVGRGFESQRTCWDFSSLKNREISALIYKHIYIYNIENCVPYFSAYKYSYIFQRQYIQMSRDQFIVDSLSQKKLIKLSEKF